VKSEAKAWVGNGEEEAFFLVECPSCHSPLFGSSVVIQDEFNNWSWDTAERLWPAPSIAEVSPAIPDAARRDIKDAQKCLSHGIYSAAAVLCGRALERLIKEKAGANMIAKGLAELKAKGIIDERLFSWAEALRKERNIGAHASDEDTTKENAQDIIDFTIAIFDYVYTLSEKYERYVARKTSANGGTVG
jgi:HEPN domain-containing protein